MNNFLKRLARVLPDDILFGESFRSAKRINQAFVESKDKVDFIASYQQQKIKSLFNIARKSLFYQYLNASAQIEKVPFIDKEMVVKSLDSMVVEKSGADYVTTGGTTGKPLGFYINKNRKGFEWYWMTKNWHEVGFNTTDYRAVLRNHKLNRKTYKIDPLLREYQYNNFSLNDNYADFVINHTLKNNIKFLHTYPSAAYILASRIKRMKSKHSLDTFLCGSETVFPFQKELIEQDLNIRMYTWYGHSEKLILAGEGKVCENYHSNPFYGVTEIIDQNGNEITTPGVSGELVGTGFINTKMPFIRYKTGDFAKFVGNECPDCGHLGKTFRNVKGRWSGDKIYKSDGSILTTTALNLHKDIYKYIRNIQYKQEIIGKLEVRVIPEINYDQRIRQLLQNELNSKIGKELKIQIVEVEKVELTNNNKFQLLIQKLDNNKIKP